MKVQNVPNIETPRPYCASDVTFGGLFSRSGCLMMRVKPIQFFLNSSLVCESINKGNVFCVNMTIGTLFIIKGNEVVRQVSQLEPLSYEVLKEIK